MPNLDPLEKYKNVLDWDEILNIRNQKMSALMHANMKKFQQAIELSPKVDPSIVDFSADVIKIGSAEDLNAQEHQNLLSALEAFIPWKKGPFEIFGHHIDSEWQSNLKWQRLQPHFKPLQKRVVADIGCNNGYFMLRMLEQSPELIVGFEPYTKHKLTFDFFNQYIKAKEIAFELLGVEHINLFPKFFDTVFCLGILYHHTDPIGLLRMIHQSMKKGGELIIDCQGIPGTQPYCLFPEGRYARGKGFWFLPTAKALENWLKRTMFKNIEIFFDEPLSLDEQRTTKWAPINSLEEFLDPNDKSKTIEGYPAPYRIYLKAQKP